MATGNAGGHFPIPLGLIGDCVIVRYSLNGSFVSIDRVSVSARWPAEPLPPLSCGASAVPVRFQCGFSALCRVFALDYSRFCQSSQVEMLS